MNTKGKLSMLKELKKAYLQKMFPQEGENVPRVRFEGFSGEWEVRKLGEVADIVGGGTPSTSNDKYWNGDIDWYAPAEIGEQIFLEGSQRKITELGFRESSARMLPVGTVLFTSRAGIGNTAILTKTGTTNQGFQSIVPHENELDSYFIFSRTHELKKYGETVGAGSTFVEVSGKQMAQMPISIPLLPEQTAIGGFFRTLDEIITLHKRKLEKLKELKKGYLQQMFPQKGENVPRVRFKGYDKPWEVKKLGDVADISSGFTGNSELENGEYRLTRIETISNWYVDENSVGFSNEKPNDKYLLNNGDILYSNINSLSHIGKVAIYEKKSNLYHGINLLRIVAKYGNCSCFLFYQFKTKSKKNWAETHANQAVSQASINQTSLLKQPFFMCILPEQTAIGSFFHTLDSQIATQTKKIEKLKQLKKACLQKMFI